MLSTLLRISLFFISLYGVSIFTVKVFKIPRNLSWMISCCIIVIALYISAFFSVLHIASILLYIISISGALLHLGISTHRKKFFWKSMTLIEIWLFFYIFMIGTTLLVTHLEHYDNFSHWATIVKFLYTENRLPNAQDAIISYTSYPMGSSLFIYYATAISGLNDNVMLIAQFTFIVSCIYAFLSIIRDKSRIMIVAMLFAGIASFNYFNISIRMNNLLVDFLLPILTLGGLAMIHTLQYRFRKLSFGVILVTSVLTLIKSSGVFFGIIILFYYSFVVINNRRKFKNNWKLIIGAIITFILSILPITVWTQYVKLHFATTKHEVDLASYKINFDEKSSIIVSEISSNFIAYLTDIHNTATQGFLLINFILITFFLVMRLVLKRKSMVIYYLLLIDVIVIVYYIGIYLMFLLSMPINEALQLAGIERYASSIIILAIGIMLMVLAREIDYSFYEQNLLKRNYRSFKSFFLKQLYQVTSLFFTFFFIIMMMSERNGLLYNISIFNKSIPSQYIEITQNNLELNDNRILVVTTDKKNVDNYYTAFVGMYYMYSNNLDAREDFVMNQDNFIHLIKSYDSVIILEDHYTFNAMTKKITGKIYPPGVYKSSDILPN